MPKEPSTVQERVDIVSFLSGIAGPEPVFYKPNPGNAGDSLIACATFQLFAETGVRFELVGDGAFDPTGKTVIYGGGGNLVEGRFEARRFIEQCHETAARLILLPHTVSGHDDLLGALGPHADLFLREEVSFEHVKRAAPHARVFLTDDLAFHLDFEARLAAECPRPYGDISLKQMIRRDAMLVREAFCRRCGKRTLSCFRTDRERTDVSAGMRNADLSKLFKCGTESVDESETATRMIFRFLSRYDVVRTNRLHLAIAGALLGKQVMFYPNSYYKCEAVYRFSMKNRFPNVQWMG